MAAGMLLAGCGGTAGETAPSSTTTTTTTSAAAAMDTFRDQLQPVVNELGKGLIWMGGAAKSLDMADLRAACRSFDGDVDQLEAVLPSPDPVITSHLQGAVTNWRQMATHCQGASLGMDVQELTRLQDAGYAELEAAVGLIKQSP